MLSPDLLIDQTWWVWNARWHSIKIRGNCWRLHWRFQRLDEYQGQSWFLPESIRIKVRWWTQKHHVMDCGHSHCTCISGRPNECICATLQSVEAIMLRDRLFQGWRQSTFVDVFQCAIVIVSLDPKERWLNEDRVCNHDHPFPELAETETTDWNS